MNATRKILNLLCMYFILVSCVAMADVVHEPDIITINNQLLVYVQVADKIVKNAEANGLHVERVNKKVTIEVKGENDLISRIIKLRNEAEAKELGKTCWVYGECENGSKENELGIYLDKKRGLIKDIMLCDKTS